MKQRQKQDGGAQRQRQQTDGGDQRQQTDGGDDQRQRAGADAAPDNQGEGNRDAARHYNASQRKFVQDGRVDAAAEEAQPQSRDEAAEMERAERQGRSHAKGEDPELRRGGDRAPQQQDRERLPDQPSAADEGAKSSDF